MKENYDVIVVGAGPAGIMTCYELYLKNPELEVLLIDLSLIHIFLIMTWLFYQGVMVEQKR